MSPDATQKAGLKKRFVHDMEQYLVISLFLFFFFFGSFTMCRRLVLAEYEIGYLDYSWALLKALVLGKVILIGELLHVGERFHDRPAAHFHALENRDVWTADRGVRSPRARGRRPDPPPAHR